MVFSWPGGEVAIVALRDQDRRQLAEIEYNLVEGDPRFAATVRTLNSRLGRASRAVRFAVAVLATYVVGLTTVICGMLLSSAVLMALGAVTTASMPVAVGWRSWREGRRARRSEARESADHAGRQRS